jgi:hypothetical protein
MGLVFIPEDRARELRDLREGLWEAKTWGQLRSRISQRRWEEVVTLSRREDEQSPKDEDPFDADQIGGYADGDWPEWPAQQMLYWMPPEIRDRCGEVWTSNFNGDALMISADDASEVLAALSEAGYVCVNDADLVAKASGY